VDIDAAWLAILLDEFPGATVDELRLRDPFARPVLQDAYPDAAVLPLGFETPDAPPVPSEPRSEPLPPRRHRPGKGAAAPDDPEPEVDGRRVLPVLPRARGPARERRRSGRRLVPPRVLGRGGASRRGLGREAPRHPVRPDAAARPAAAPARHTLEAPPVTAPETATIELRDLCDALAEGDGPAWTAFRHAAEAADGLDAHPGLARCAGCREPWTDDLGPLALVEARLGGDLALGLLCAACARGGKGDLVALLEAILRAMLPEGSRVVAARVVSGAAGHA
jgi:hypothetical protein